MPTGVEGRHTDIVQESLHAVPYFFALKLNKPETMLDVGIGDGVALARALTWADTKPELTVGLDINRSTFGGFPHGIKVAQVIADGLALPFCDNTFSLVTSFQVIEHIDPRRHDTFLEEMMRVVKPGCNVLIATMNKDFPYNVRGHKAHIAEFGCEELQVFADLCCSYGNIELYVVIPSQRYIEAQAKRAKFWMFRLIKDLIPRSVSEVFLSVMTGGKIHADLDMREDFQVKKFEDVIPRKIFTDFLISITKKTF